MTTDQKATYKAALKEARTAFSTATRRLDEATREVNALKSEISRLRQTITALAALCSESPGFDRFGITEACSEVMETITYSATTALVVSELVNLGFDIASQKNVNASVHVVLSRLAEKGQIEKIPSKDGDGQDITKWRGPKYDKDWEELVSGDVPF